MRLWTIYLYIIHKWPRIKQILTYQIKNDSEIQQKNFENVWGWCQLLIGITPKHFQNGRGWSAFLGCWWEFNVFITVLVQVHYFIIAALSFTFKCPSINFSGCDSMVCPITPYIAYYCQLCATSPVPYYDIMLIFPISIISFLYT